ncbi:winged helix-turn-helix transcriptional regulator [archaeon]|nr:winged helix-turn-helix transcriptional regulator [archaeon]
MGPMHPYNNNWIIEIIPILLGLIIALLILIIVYLWINQNKDRKLEKIDEPESETGNLDKIDVAIRLLNDNEKLIVQALIDNDGDMLQKDISTELGLSRVQTHRSIQSLIERDIVTTEDYFNTKKVTLSKWLYTE